jgi:hypothetical protein
VFDFSKYRDPLHTLLDYIATVRIFGTHTVFIMGASPILTHLVQNALECDMALVHDGDLELINVSVCSFSSVDWDIHLTLLVMGNFPSRCSLSQSAELQARNRVYSVR